MFFFLSEESHLLAFVLRFGGTFRKADSIRYLTAYVLNARDTGGKQLHQEMPCDLDFTEVEPAEENSLRSLGLSSTMSTGHRTEVIRLQSKYLNLLTSHASPKPMFFISTFNS